MIKMTPPNLARKLLFTIAFIFYSPLSLLHAENLVSRPVGILQIKISEQSQNLVSMPFQPFNALLDDVFCGQLTGSTNEQTADRILKWDAVIQEYRRAFKMDRSGDTNLDGRWLSDFITLSNSDLTLSPGEGFFIDNRQSVSQRVYIAGRIVLDATNEVALYPGLNLVGYPFSSAGPLPMGQGSWEANTSGTVRVFLETRPYADVFPLDNSLPAISDIRILPASSFKSHPSALLSIQCAGTMLDVFYKDLVATNVFDSEHDWLIAESNILVSSRDTIEWKDQGGGDRPPVNEVFSRVYLLARADIDSDGNGIPDAREIFVMGTRTLQQQNESFNTSGSAALETQNLGISTNSSDGTTSNAVPFQPNIILGKIIYVDRAIGCDTFSGKSPVIVGSDGPKSSIKAGLAAVGAAGGMVIIKSGKYGDEDLNIAGKNVSVVIDGNVDLSGTVGPDLVSGRGVTQGDALQTNVSNVATNGL